jgi:hypothetical protein
MIASSSASLSLADAPLEFTHSGLSPTQEHPQPAREDLSFLPTETASAWFSRTSIGSRYLKNVDTRLSNINEDDSDEDRKRWYGMAHIMGDLPSEASSDPDAQAAVTDFMDFTEHLPADVYRSLTLIQQLNETADDSTVKLNELLKKYKDIPTLTAQDRPDAIELRKQISHHMNRIQNARESAFAESARMSQFVNRHEDRLRTITTKLEALPKPPYRDPTPPPVSPDIKRSQSGRKLAQPKKLVMNGPDSTRQVLKLQHRRRNTRITVPGEVLPPINPDSPLPTDFSDVDSEPESPIPVPTSRVGATQNGSLKPEKMKEPVKLKISQPKPPRATPRQPGMGTNVHSQVAGISTSNALAKLKPPPPNAPLGSEYAPWTRLTEYEMAYLRKSMKKNAVWTPSRTMIRKTLFDRGRGWENFWKAKAEADANGTPLLDPENIADWKPGRALKSGEIGPDEKGLDEATITNRGMKLNEAKKQKKQKEAEENERLIAELNQAIASGDRVKISEMNARMAMTRLEKSAEGLRKLAFSNNVTNQLTTPSNKAGNAATPSKPKSTPKPKATPKLPQPSETSTPEAQSIAEPSTKKRKIKPAPAPTDTTKSSSTVLPGVSIDSKALVQQRAFQNQANAAAPVSASKASTPLPSPTESKAATDAKATKLNLALRSSAAPKTETPTTSTAPTTRPSSRRRSAADSAADSAAASVEPSIAPTRDRLRRKSASSASVTPAIPVEAAPKATTPATAASHRSKRPAPGLVTDNQDGGAAVSVSRRKAAPKKKAAAVKDDKEKQSKAEKDKAATGKEIRVDIDGVLEEIDPNEPRFCLCGDVSYGDMVACENNDVSLPSLSTLFFIHSTLSVVY